MGALSRTKGHQYERDTANLYREAGDKGARRGRQEYSGECVADVRLSHPAITNWWPSCKNYTKLPPVMKVWGEAVADAVGTGKPSLSPILHLHESNGPHLVVMDRDQFFTLLRSYLK